MATIDGYIKSEDSDRYGDSVINWEHGTISFRDNTDRYGDSANEIAIEISGENTADVVITVKADELIKLLEVVKIAPEFL